MIRILFISLSITSLLLSCNKENEEAKVIEPKLINNWWEVSCIDINQGSGQTNISGKLDCGKFYFYGDGSCTRNSDSLKLEYCYPIDSIFKYVIGPNGWGTPFGEINGGSENYTWSIKDNEITINQWGSWQIDEYNDSIISFKSSRTNFLYQYTLAKK